MRPLHDTPKSCRLISVSARKPARSFGPLFTHSPSTSPCPDRCRVDHGLHPRQLRVCRIEVQGSMDVLEGASHPCDHHVPRSESCCGVAWLKCPIWCGLSRRDDACLSRSSSVRHPSLSGKVTPYSAPISTYRSGSRAILLNISSMPAGANQMSTRADSSVRFVKLCTTPRGT